MFQNLNCTERREDYLRQFGEKYDFNDFCLAFVFTFLDFHNGTAGLAHIGTACYQSDPSQNTGFVTLLNYDRERTLEESRYDMIFQGWI